MFCWFKQVRGWLEFKGQEIDTYSWWESSKVTSKRAWKEKNDRDDPEHCALVGSTGWKGLHAGLWALIAHSRDLGWLLTSYSACTQAVWSPVYWLWLRICFIWFRACAARLCFLSKTIQNCSKDWAAKAGTLSEVELFRTSTLETEAHLWISALLSITVLPWMNALSIWFLMQKGSFRIARVSNGWGEAPREHGKHGAELSPACTANA